MRGIPFGLTPVNARAATSRSAHVIAPAIRRRLSARASERLAGGGGARGGAPPFVGGVSDAPFARPFVALPFRPVPTLVRRKSHSMWGGSRSGLRCRMRRTRHSEKPATHAASAHSA
jgi:hypothetical protein